MTTDRPSRMAPLRDESGTALITVLMLVALLSVMLASYFLFTRVELMTTKSSMDSTQGFFVGEAGLNIRAEEIRQTFQGFDRPTGTTPVITPGEVPCTSDSGAGDFACQTHPFSRRSAITYVSEDPSNPTPIVIPAGETIFANLNAEEYDYTVRSIAVNDNGAVEALLEMQFKSRLVPLFQFAVFYNKDLEITPGPAMTISGAVHTNYDLYVDTLNTIDIFGNVTVSDSIFNGKKEANICLAGPVSVEDSASVLQQLPACDPMVGRREILQSELTAWGGTITRDLDPVTVPPPDAIDPVGGQVYWDNADLRILYDVDTATVELKTVTHTTHTSNPSLATCAPNTVYTTSAFTNRREGDKIIDMLEIDMVQLLDCIVANPGIIDNKGLDDASNGGLVFYLGVTGTDQDTINNYGVRVTNAREIAATAGPAINGMTVVTNQAMYLWGHYNETNKIPAAVLSDSINILSENYTPGTETGHLFLAPRAATATTINAALLSGTDSTGGGEGAGFQGGTYGGGVQNFLRLHEHWQGVTLTYLGSLVSLNQPAHVNGPLYIGFPQYTPATRNFSFDTDFNSMANLPPLTPSFVYLKHEMFMRDYEY